MTELNDFHALVLVISIAPLLVAAVTDMREFRIPNECSALLLILYPVHIWLAPMGIDILGGLLVGGCIFAVTFTLYALDRLGGGDVKLLSVMGLWAGPAYAADLIVITTLAGAGLGLILLSRAGASIAMGLDRIGETSARDNVLSERMPYGVAITCGGLATLWSLVG